MTRELPLTVLAWEGPQARAYLVRMRRAGLQPARVLLMVRDQKAEKKGKSARLHGLSMRRAEHAQDRSHNFHPYAIRRERPDLVKTIAAAMGDVVADPASYYDEMFDGFRYEDCAPTVERVGANSYKDPGLLAALGERTGETYIYTGGGIVPRALFDVPGIRIVHVHTGFLPHVRGADVLLWSLLVRGRPGVSAFYMSPGLDEGDVLATRELDPLAIPLADAVRPDDDTLYRALFSFVDPLLRAELLVTDVLEPAAQVTALPSEPQALDVGVTFHFMHPAVRARALGMLYPRGESTHSSSSHAEVGNPADYQRYYDRLSTRAPMKFVADATRAGSSVRARSIRNRQKDYGLLSKRPDLLVIHRELNRQLALQTAEWESYDYGEGYFYQSCDPLGITGLRDTTARVEAFGMRDLVGGRSVLEIGCNSGFLSLAIAGDAERVVAFELNPYLIAIARIAARFTQTENVDFEVAAFEDFVSEETFDDVLSFANHHTYDGNTRQPLTEYFARCYAFTKPGGRLIFESHPPELEGDSFHETLAIMERFYELSPPVVHEYGTFLDANRRFIVGVRRPEAS